MQTKRPNDYLLDEKVEQVLNLLKRVVLGFFIALLVAITMVLILEIKREYGIDLVKGVNFSLDDWYFDNIQ
ncbi:hypothetical protein QQ054_21110 [Oscillatoria amoena NRMC-F 0135]|nr:hypothetical protein [Oscillatoria amoena NRMC-F 0135]